jgi:hypothetical protein
LSKAKDSYQNNMETLLAGEPFDDIQAKHVSIKESSISEFDSKKKMGGKKFSEE